MASNIAQTLRQPSDGSSISKNIGDRTIYVENHGCSANKFDLELMLACLHGAGYSLTNNINRADIILINTCGVKKPTEDRIIEKVRRFSQLSKPLIVTGCLPRINLRALVKAAPEFSAMLDPQSVDKILVAVSNAEMGQRRRTYFSARQTPKLEQPKVRLNPCVEIVQISEGCAGTCAYCCVRFARGALFSYPQEMILRRIDHAISQGAKEIWLTSQDNGAYGLDTKTNLAELLRECCRFEGRFLVRVGMMNPNHVLRMLPELIDAYRDEKVFKFLHLPVQCGDNETLKRMNRGYTVERFRKIINSFRKAIPEITLSTDVICGFPGESREAFGRTIKLVEEVQPDIVNISRFFPRPNTAAAGMEQLDYREVKERSRELTALVRKISPDKNSRWVGWQGEVLVDEKGKGSSWIGRNYAYKPIVIKDPGDLFGKFIHAKVVKAFPTYLEAEPLQ